MAVTPLTIPSLSQRPGGFLRLSYWWLFVRPREVRNAESSIEGQVGVRTHRDVSVSWDESGLRPNKVILNMLARYGRLDASKLVPSDPLEVVIQCFVDDMHSVELAVDFRREFKVELPSDLSEMTVGRLHEMAPTRVQH